MGSSSLSLETNTHDSGLKNMNRLAFLIIPLLVFARFAVDAKYLTGKSVYGENAEIADQKIMDDGIENFNLKDFDQNKIDRNSANSFMSSTKAKLAHWEEYAPERRPH